MYVAGTAGKGLGNIVQCDRCGMRGYEDGYEQRRRDVEEDWRRREEDRKP